MKVFNCILGVFTVFASLYCLCFPGITFLGYGWLLSILVGVWGICMIFDYFSKKKHSDEQTKKVDISMGVFGLIFGILAAVLSIVAIFVPSVRITMDAVFLCMLAGWLVVAGIVSVAQSFETKKSGSKMWILTLLMGILIILTGIYGVFHLIFLAQFIGIYIGITFAIYGVRLIMSVFEN